MAGESFVFSWRPRREVICFLLSLPPEQREELEAAENYTFTMEWLEKWTEETPGPVTQLVAFFSELKGSLIVKLFRQSGHVTRAKNMLKCKQLLNASADGEKHHLPFLHILIDIEKLRHQEIDISNFFFSYSNQVLSSILSWPNEQPASKNHWGSRLHGGKLPKWGNLVTSPGKAIPWVARACWQAANGRSEFFFFFSGPSFDEQNESKWMIDVICFKSTSCDEKKWVIFCALFQLIQESYLLFFLKVLVPGEKNLQTTACAWPCWTSPTATTVGEAFC